MSTPRKLVIASLAALSVLLAVVFFLVYFGGNDTQGVELTAVSTDAADTGVPVISAETASPEAALSDEPPEIRVYVAGAVHHPGVYPLETGDRVVDAMEAAGGATDHADLETVNLAMRVEDEGYYYIPAKTAQAASNSDSNIPDISITTPPFPEAATNRPATESPGETTESVTDTGEPAGLVNLNTATQAELETLPSIGPSRAGAIVAYRQENGPFAAVDEITAVSGIGQGILDNLQGLITVAASP